jgi:hypothetical protein
MTVFTLLMAIGDPGDHFEVNVWVQVTITNSNFDWL